MNPMVHPKKRIHEMGIFAKMPTKCHFDRLNFENIFGCKHTRTPPKQKLPWCDLRAPLPLTHLQESQTQTYNVNMTIVKGIAIKKILRSSQYYKEYST